MKTSFEKPKFQRSGLVVAALLGCLALVPRSAYADTIGYNIGIDTGNLGPGNYNFFFSLGDSDGVANTTTTVNNFTTTPTTGTSSYINSTPFTLTDLGTTTNDQVSFTAGGRVNFNLTANYSPSNDTFFVSVFDSANADVPTTDPLGRSALFELNFNGSGFQTYNFTAGPAPTVRVVATPEPATWAMMLIGVALVIGMMKRGRKSDAVTEKELAREAVA
jgi:phosphate/sulfate permease